MAQSAVELSGEEDVASQPCKLKILVSELTGNLTFICDTHNSLQEELRGDRKVWLGQPIQKICKARIEAQLSKLFENETQNDIGTETA